MKKNMKLILAVSCLFCYFLLLPIEARADESLKIGPNVTAYYNSNLGTLTISGTGEMGEAVPSVDLRYKNIRLGNSDGADGTI